MTTTAQEALAAHLLYQKQHWSTMTTTQKDAWIRTREDLELNAEAEIAANLAEEQLLAAQAIAAQVAAQVAAIQADGYVGDNSLNDYLTLYQGRKDIFGDHWQEQATAAHAESTGIETFIDQWLKYQS